MSTTRPHAALEDLRVPLRTTLAAAWTSFMFLYIYVDHLRPGPAGSGLARHRRHGKAASRYIRGCRRAVAG